MDVTITWKGSSIKTWLRVHWSRLRNLTLIECVANLHLLIFEKKNDSWLSITILHLPFWEIPAFFTPNKDLTNGAISFQRLCTRGSVRGQVTSSNQISSLLALHLCYNLSSVTWTMAPSGAKEYRWKKIHHKGPNPKKNTFQLDSDSLACLAVSQVFTCSHLSPRWWWIILQSPGLISVVQFVVKKLPCSLVSKVNSIRINYKHRQC